MKVRLSKEFRFEASHRLMHLPPDHPCYRLHGHSYKIEIEVYGTVNEQTGFLIDYADVKQIVDPIIDQLDHRHLNDIDGLSLPSSEHIARWLWQKIAPKLPIISRVSVFETASTRCDYFGE